MGYSHQEEAVLDYVAISQKVLPKVELFRVVSESNSDHIPLEMILDEKLKYLRPTRRTVQAWGPSEKLRFKDRMFSSRPAADWRGIHDKLWSATAKREVLKGVAGEKGWWNEECYNRRKEMWDTLSMVRAGLKNPEEIRTNKKNYKLAIKEAKGRFKETIREELDKVKGVNDGWKFIKKYGQQRDSAAINPNIRESMVPHFKRLLQGDEEDPPTPPQQSPKYCMQLPDGEFNHVIQHLKENKAAGPDQLKAEAVIYADAGTREEIRRLIENILNGRDIPKEWCESTIVPLYKKGYPLDPANYRGIAIGNVIYKILAMVVNKRLLNEVEEKEILPDTQNGFRRERSTVDNIAILKDPGDPPKKEQTVFPIRRL